MEQERENFRRMNNERGTLVDRLLTSPLAKEMAFDNEPATAIVDLLADIRHWCDLHGQEFAELDSRAYGHYTTEVVQARTGEEQ